MNKIVKSNAAKTDLDNLAVYLQQQGSPELAVRFLRSANQTFEQLASMPGLAGHWETASNPTLADLRVWQVKGFPNHLIFYREIPDGIEVIRVLHGSQDIEGVFGEGE